jgi:hypothetical protein
MRAPPGPPAAAKPPVEFDQAISYVNKIKVGGCCTRMTCLPAGLPQLAAGPLQLHQPQSAVLPCAGNATLLGGVAFGGALLRLWDTRHALHPPDPPFSHTNMHKDTARSPPS